MRTKKAHNRTIALDPKYQSIAIAKLVNRTMKSGKKSVAAKQIYQALEQTGEALKRKPVEVLDEVIKNVMPQMEVRSRRVGGASYQVPMPVRYRRGFTLAIRWLVQEANKRPNKQYHTFADKLSAEMLDALQNKGGAIERKLTSYRMAEANKAFAHFRW